MLEPAELRGAYDYRLNGEATDVQEHWVSRALGDGRLQVYSERSAPGVHLSVEAVVENGAAQYFQCTWVPDEGDVLAVEYRFFRGELLVLRRAAGVASESITPLHHDTVVLFPLMRVFVGPVIETLLGAGGEGLVVLPRLDASAESPQFLEPLLSERRARVLGEETLELDGAPIQCRRCEYLGERYDESAAFWLDCGGMLRRYRWRESGDRLWDVSLVPAL